MYAMSKAAVAGLTKGLARDLASRGITVNNVQPGPVDTDMNPASGDFAITTREYTALKRYGSPMRSRTSWPTLPGRVQATSRAPTSRSMADGWHNGKWFASLHTPKVLETS